jgi:hypothetical protein
MTTAADILSRIKKSLSAIVGPVDGSVSPTAKLQEMNRDQYLGYCQKQIELAKSEPLPSSRKRLSALAKSAATVSPLFEDEDVDQIKVPIYECEQTAVEEQSTTATTPVAAAGTNPSVGNFPFEKALELLTKAAGSMADTAASGGQSISEDDADADETKSKAKKRDDVAWPEDVNDPEFAKTQKNAPLEWGSDDKPAPRP